MSARFKGTSIATRIRMLQDVLPKGQTLPLPAWKRRHHVVVALVVMHALGLAIFGATRGFGTLHSVLEAAIPLGCAVLASISGLSRTQRSVIATFGLLTASALVVHFSGGVIEAHFHFFVMVAVVSLYQDWTPFLAAIGYVVFQHGTIGVIFPESVYNHPAALQNPWKWAAVHGLFIAGESIACLAYWRLSEDAFSARHLAEDKAARSEETFRSAFRNALAGMLLTDPSGTILEINDSFCRIIKYSEAELRGMNWRDITHPDDISASLAAGDAIREGETNAGQMTSRLVRQDGNVATVEIAFSAVRDESGEILYFVSQVQDITERLNSEQERQHLESQLQVSQKMDAVGRLAGGIAHDFNNLLAVILNFTTFVQEALPPEDPTSQDIDEIRKAAKKGAGLVRQLLTFSRREIARPSVIALNEVVEDMENLLARAIGEDIEFQCALEPDIPPVLMDAGQLEQVVMNLAVNARDAMPRGGKLIIRTSQVVADESVLERHRGMPAGTYVCMTISDTGKGMDSETESHIFEPFFTTKPRGEGSGLGLATVYGIVKASGGQIGVYSEPDVGTTFRIYLPAVEHMTPIPQADTEQPPRAGAGETILVVEDDDAVRKLIMRLLTQNGYKVIPASSADEALKVVDLHGLGINLVLTDVIMPRMSGKELVDRLREDRPEVKAIFMSGYTDQIIAQQGLLAVGIDFLEKPFEKDELLRKIAETLADDASPVARPPENQGDIKVLIVEDDQPMTDLLRLMLEPTFEVVGDAKNASEAMTLAHKSSPNIVLLDYQLVGTRGDELAPMLRDALPELKVVAFTAELKDAPDWADEFMPKERITELIPLLKRTSQPVG